MKLNSYKALLGSLLLAAVISSCADREDSATLGKSSVNISAGVRSQAANGQWNTNDVIGIAMLAKNDQKVIAPYSNYGYKTNGDGNFTPGQADKIIYFPQDGSEVTFKSYYPYQSELGDVSAISLSVADQKDLPAIDFMSAEHVSGFTKADSKVELRFYHRLSKLIFNLKLEGGEELPVTGELVMKGMKSGATYNLMSETLAVDVSTGQDITAGATADGVRTAIVMPRAEGEGISFVFKTTDGRVYTALMDKTLKLEGGYKYTFNIVLKKTPIEVSAIIEDWIEAPAVNAHAICVNSQAKESLGVTAGDIMHLYNKEKGKLIDFTYTKNPAGGDKAYVWNPATPVYWESLSKDKNTFYASIIGAKALNDTQLPDILIAGDTEVEYNHGVDLAFKHAATKVIIKLNSKDGTFTADELKKATITLPNYLTGGKEEGGRFIAGTKTGTIEVFMTDGQPEGTAIFDSQTIKSGSKLAIVTLNNREYIVNLNKDFEYKAGEALELTLNMSKTEITVSAKIIEWETVTAEKDAIEVGTTVSGGVNVEDKDEMNVYYGDEAKRDFLTKFTYASASNIWTAETTCYWESLANPTTFYAEIKRDYTKKGVGLAYDYLTAKQMVSANNGIAFTFNHVSSQVMITLQGAAFTTEEREGAQITLPSYDIYDSSSTTENGVFKPTIKQSQNLVVKKTDNKINSALIPEQTIAAGATIAQIIIKGRTYTVTSTEPIKYEIGKTTHLKITIEKTMVTVSAMVTEWVENPVELVVPPIVISGTLEGTTLSDGSSIQVYRMSSSTYQTTHKYTYSSAMWTSETPLYWDDQFSSLNLSAVYIPTIATEVVPATLDGTFDCEVPTDQKKGFAAYDWYISDTRIDHTSPTHFNFKFHHALSKVKVNLKKGTGFTDAEFENAVVTLHGFNLNGKANISIQNPAVSVNGSTTSDITPYPVTKAAGADIVASFEALVVPQTHDATTSFITVKLPSCQPFIGKLENTLPFTAGKSHVITVTLNKTGITLSATLEEWTAGDSGNVTID